MSVLPHGSIGGGGEEKEEKEEEKEKKEKKEEKPCQAPTPWIAVAFARVASLTRMVPMGNMRDLLVRGGNPAHGAHGASRQHGLGHLR